MGLPSKEDRLSIERTVQEIYASKERHGRVGPGRAAECEKFPLVEDELARPYTSLAITSKTPYVAIDERGLVRSIHLFLFSCVH